MARLEKANKGGGTGAYFLQKAPPPKRGGGGQPQSLCHKQAKIPQDVREKRKGVRRTECALWGRKLACALSKTHHQSRPTGLGCARLMREPTGLRARRSHPRVPRSISSTKTARVTVRCTRPRVSTVPDAMRAPGSRATEIVGRPVESALLAWARFLAECPRNRSARPRRPGRKARLPVASVGQRTNLIVFLYRHEWPPNHARRQCFRSAGDLFARTFFGSARLGLI